jgi:PEP-CTERM motif-containing protein
MKKFAFVLLALAAFSVMALPAMADAALDFALQPPTPGSISYAGKAHPLIGKNLQVDSVVGLSTPLHSGANIQILNGSLNFTTGLFDGYSNTPGLQAWDFASGGSLTLSGCVDILTPGDHKCDAGDPQGVLLQGHFGAVTVQAFGKTFKVLGAEFFNVTNPLLAEYFGFVPNSQWEGGLNLSFMATGLPPGAFKSSQALSGDIVDSPVPEPASLALLGTAFCGLASLTKKKLGR